MGAIAVAIMEQGEPKDLLNLRDLRIDAGFRSQLALAKAAGLTRSTIWLAENGQTIAYSSARLIVNALKKQGKVVEVRDIDWRLRWFE